MKFVLDKTVITRHFDNAAQHYDDFSLIQREIGKRLMARLEYMRIDPLNIVDLGSGTGFFSNELNQHYPKAKIIAIDNAQAMLDIHQQRGNAANMQFILADMEQLPLEDNSVDLIFANQVVHWANRLTDVFAECHRVLRPEGLLLFSTLGPKSFYQLRESFAEVDDHPHVHLFYEMLQVGDALVQTHFNQPVVDREMLEVTYADVPSLLRDLKGAGVQNAAHHRQKGLMGKQRLQKMMTAYEQFKTPKQRYPLQYEVIYGQAWAVQQNPTGIFETRIAADAIPFRHKTT